MLWEEILHLAMERAILQQFCLLRCMPTTAAAAATVSAGISEQRVVERKDRSKGSKRIKRNATIVGPMSASAAAAAASVKEADRHMAISESEVMKPVSFKAVKAGAGNRAAAAALPGRGGGSSQLGRAAARANAANEKSPVSAVSQPSKGADEFLQQCEMCSNR